MFCHHWRSFSVHPAVVATLFFFVGVFQFCLISCAELCLVRVCGYWATLLPKSAATHRMFSWLPCCISSGVAVGNCSTKTYVYTRVIFPDIIQLR